MNWTRRRPHLDEPEKIRQAVVNLVINLADATGQGGKMSSHSDA